MTMRSHHRDYVKDLSSQRITIKKSCRVFPLRMITSSKTRFFIKFHQLWMVLLLLLLALPTLSFMLQTRVDVEVRELRSLGRHHRNPFALVVTKASRQQQDANASGDSERQQSDVKDNTGGNSSHQTKSTSKGKANRNYQPLEEDIAKRLSLSKDRTLSALSQPKLNEPTTKSKSKQVITGGDEASTKSNTGDNNRNNRSLLPPPSPRETIAGTTASTTTFPGRNDSRKESNRNRPFRSTGGRKSSRSRQIDSDQKSDLLPKKTFERRRQRPGDNEESANQQQPWLASAGSMDPSNSTTPSPAQQPFSSLLPPPLGTSPPLMGGGNRGRANSNSFNQNEIDEEDDPLSSGLSSWEEFLGYSGLPSRRRSTQPKTIKNTDSDNPVFDSTRLPSIQDLFPSDISSSDSNKSTRNQRTRQSAQLALDGVLPVSDLFYRSPTSEDAEDHDDEELPFSAEQSDAVISDNNKVRIRRNLATQNLPSPLSSRRTMSAKSRALSSPSVPSPTPYPTNATVSRKMVRRGMEMLVGGVPINADPPQRCIELMYQSGEDWAQIVSLNNRDFGPMLYSPMISKLSPVERGIYLEFWSHAALKWDVCPKDMRQIIKSYKIQQKNQLPSTSNVAPDIYPIPSVVSRASSENRRNTTTVSNWQPSRGQTGSRISSSSSAVEKRGRGLDGEEINYYETNGECTFEVGLTSEEMESASIEIFEDVFGRAIISCIEKAVLLSSYRQGDFWVEVPDLRFTATDIGFTDIHVTFKIKVATTAHEDDTVEKKTKRIQEALQQAMDDGDIALSLAAAAQEETRWPQSLRDRIVEECLFQEDDLDEQSEVPDARQDNWPAFHSKVSTEPDGLESENVNEGYSDANENSTESDEENVVNLDTPSYTKEDLFLGGGRDGVFFDFSEGNMLNAPYSGDLGPLLVDAVVERAKHRQPRVIAIGDVHGCIDELQDLLRECDYRPGDLVVFLGDLVCKGPDSISVVQMAREIGALGVRGNHDFEVVRWHQAIKSGVDPPVVGSEHFHIASCLSKADMKWMYSLPWYISSKDLSCLFVHAGFVSGIRLAKQNPRLMMNMRSILPDGTVTSKFFNNWPWARLWDGPQTVLFGHDADRGLQQYEHAIGLDTGCVYGGRLTACILPEKRLVSVSARREYFKYRRKHYD